jgi:hypothetical protein
MSMSNFCSPSIMKMATQGAHILIENQSKAERAFFNHGHDVEEGHAIK